MRVLYFTCWKISTNSKIKPMPCLGRSPRLTFKKRNLWCLLKYAFAPITHGLLLKYNGAPLRRESVTIQTDSLFMTAKAFYWAKGDWIFQMGNSSIGNLLLDVWNLWQRIWVNIQQWSSEKTDLLNKHSLSELITVKVKTMSWANESNHYWSHLMLI